MEWTITRPPIRREHLHFAAESGTLAMSVDEWVVAEFRGGCRHILAQEKCHAQGKREHGIGSVTFAGYATNRSSAFSQSSTLHQAVMLSGRRF
jgi:hypothetical protein